MESRRKNNGEVKGDVKITNGNTSDGSRPDSPLSDENDDDLQAKEKLIAHFRNELKQEEAKLLLLKQPHKMISKVAPYFKKKMWRRYRHKEPLPNL